MRVLVAAPAAVQDFRVELINASLAIAHWLPPTPAHAPIDHYTLHISNGIAGAVTHGHDANAVHWRHEAYVTVPAAVSYTVLSLPCQGHAQGDDGTAHLLLFIRMWPVALNGSSQLKGINTGT